MASDVDICNLAVGHLGDRATISSINPPEGSAQAEHCARFYSIARDMTLEAHEWGFATKRMNMALLGQAATTTAGASGVAPPPEWLYVYQMPSDCRNIIKLRDPNVSPDIINGCYPYPYPGEYPQLALVQQSLNGDESPYEQEVLTDGTQVVYTNLQNAIIQYVSSVTDTTKFSAQFVDAVAWLLASYIAGPLIKGTDGAAMAKVCAQAYAISLSQAKTADANNRRRTRSSAERPATWIANR